MVNSGLVLTSTIVESKTPFENIPKQNATKTEFKYLKRTDSTFKSEERNKYEFLLWEFETRVIWFNVISFLITHMLALYSLFNLVFYRTMTITAFFNLAVLSVMAGFGVTGGAHRFWTHRSFKANLPLRIVLLICYSVAGQNTLIEWVRDHRIHHTYSETDADPHNSNRGLFFSHMGWLLMRKKSEVLKRGKELNLSDMYSDPVVMFDHKYHGWLKLVLCFAIPIVVPPLMWSEKWSVSLMITLVRYLFALHCTWSVNSFAHMYGNKPYDKRINPSQNKLVCFFSMGEGYHNYHHTFPWDYRAAEIGQRLNLTTFFLNQFQKIGWAYGMKFPSKKLVETVSAKHGDGSYQHHHHEEPYKEEYGHEEISNSK